VVLGSGVRPTRGLAPWTRVSPAMRLVLFPRSRN